MKFKELLTRLLELEAADSGIPGAAFKLGYFLSFVSNYPHQAMVQDAIDRIAHLESRITTPPKP